MKMSEKIWGLLVRHYPVIFWMIGLILQITSSITGDIEWMVHAVFFYIVALATHVGKILGGNTTDIIMINHLVNLVYTHEEKIKELESRLGTDKKNDEVKS